MKNLIQSRLEKIVNSLLTKSSACIRARKKSLSSVLRILSLDASKDTMPPFWLMARLAQERPTPWVVATLLA